MILKYLYTFRYLIDKSNNEPKSESNIFFLKCDNI